MSCPSAHFASPLECAVAKSDRLTSLGCGGWEPDPYRSSVQVKIAVVLAEPDLGIKQFREVFFAEDRGLGPVRKNPSLAQQHHSRDFRNDFRQIGRAHV